MTVVIILAVVIIVVFIFVIICLIVILPYNVLLPRRLVILIYLMAHLPTFAINIQGVLTLFSTQLLVINCYVDLVVLTWRRVLLLLLLLLIIAPVPTACVLVTYGILSKVLLLL